MVLMGWHFLQGLLNSQQSISHKWICHRACNQMLAQQFQMWVYSCDWMVFQRWHSCPSCWWCPADMVLTMCIAVVTSRAVAVVGHSGDSRFSRPSPFPSCWKLEVLDLCSPSPLLHNIRVMVIVWRLRGNIIRTALCWIVWHNVHSQHQTYMSSSYRSNRLGLSHWDPYAVRRGCCLELYYCNMVEWFWWDSILISTTSWFPLVLWHCGFGRLACKNHPWNDL